MSDKTPNIHDPFDDLLPIDDMEEEISENGQTVKRKGIYLLPNIFTLAALFAGFFVIVNAIQGQFATAAAAIFVAMFFDGLDGRIARMINAQSKFGAELDSLSDVVSFGVAPALLVFNWSLIHLGKVGWAITFLYIACAAVRLARFNTQIDNASSGYFSGLASPPSAAVLAAMVWVCFDNGWHGEDLFMLLSIGSALITALCGLLMVTNIEYYSFKSIDFRSRVPFVAVFFVILIVSIILIDPALVLLFMATTYACSGPLIRILKRLKPTPKTLGHL